MESASKDLEIPVGNGKTMEQKPFDRTKLLDTEQDKNATMLHVPENTLKEQRGVTMMRGPEKSINEQLVVTTIPDPERTIREQLIPVSQKGDTNTIDLDPMT